MIEFDACSWTVEVPGCSCEPIKVSIEDIRPALRNDSFASLIQHASDELDENIVDLLSSLSPVTTTGTPSSGHLLPTNDVLDPSTDVYFLTHDLLPDYRTNNSFSDSPVVPKVGDRIEIFWPIDNAFYPGQIQSLQNGQHCIHYDDGDTEAMNMTSEAWRFLSASTQPPPLLRSQSHDVLSSMLNYSGNRTFMPRRVHTFPPHVILIDNRNEGTSFKRTVRVVSTSSVDQNA